MKKDITICIGTVGGPTFKKCHRIASKIADRDPRVKDLIIIKNEYPTSSWLNEMRISSETTWTLQVDEDMYLYDNCIDELILLAKRKEAAGVKILNASSLLFDLFLKTRIGSLKLWNTKSFMHGKFKDVQGSDRQFAIDLDKCGFSNVAISKVLGEHDSAPNIEIAYFKYKEYIEKIIKFQGINAAHVSVRSLKKIYKQRGDEIGKFAYAGGLEGIRLFDDKIDPKTKDKRDNVLTRKIIAKINSGIL